MIKQFKSIDEVTKQDLLLAARDLIPAGCVLHIETQHRELIYAEVWNHMNREMIGRVVFWIAGDGGIGCE